MAAQTALSQLLKRRTQLKASGRQLSSDEASGLVQGTLSAENNKQLGLQQFSQETQLNKRRLGLAEQQFAEQKDQFDVRADAFEQQQLLGGLQGFGEFLGNENNITQLKSGVDFVSQGIDNLVTRLFG